MPTPRMTEDEIWSFVSESHTGILTTLRKDGVPIALPLWFVCIDHKIYARTRGKKLQRIQHDQRASFLVELGVKWEELKAVHITGKAEIVDLDEELSRQFRDETARKYGSSRMPAAQMPKESAEHYAAAIGGVVRFSPDEGRILNWDNSKLIG